MGLVTVVAVRHSLLRTVEVANCSRQDDLANNKFRAPKTKNRVCAWRTCGRHGTGRSPGSAWIVCVAGRAAHTIGGVIHRSGGSGGDLLGDRCL